jgi:hypothetical protein
MSTRSINEGYKEVHGGTRELNQNFLKADHRAI